MFVTLRKGGRLRGCIGSFEARDDLPTMVRTMAIAAAGDPRFVQMPISLAEFADVRVEISVLSPLRRVDDPSEIQVGPHGIHVKRGPLVGCFLPSVATDNGWDRETFLTQCCGQKAGMDPGAWQSPDTEISVFTVEKITEA